MNYLEFTIPLGQEHTCDSDEIFADILTAELGELEFESFVNEGNLLKCYIQIDLWNEENFNANDFLSGIEKDIIEIEQQNWNAEWEKSFSPIVVDDKCIIRASFQEVPENIIYDIVIDPKMSFGTGHHETTYLMCSFLMDEEVENMTVLDMGCGTGVLAILAAKKNANYVEAIDIDEWAYTNTLENITNNGTPDIIVKEGGAEVISDKSFDVILANINRNILLMDMDKYASKLPNGGVLFLSGFYEQDIPVLETKANELGLEIIDKKVKNHWTSLKLAKI